VNGDSSPGYFGSPLQRLAIYTLFVWLISHQSAVLFSQNKSTISNQPAVFLSQNESAPVISHQPNGLLESGGACKYSASFWRSEEESVFDLITGVLDAIVNLGLFRRRR
jgi:hypothetical protein